MIDRVFVLFFQIVAVMKDSTRYIVRGKIIVLEVESNKLCSFYNIITWVWSPHYIIINNRPGYITLWRDDDCTKCYHRSRHIRSQSLYEGFHSLAYGKCSF